MRTHHECACGILLVELLCSSTTSVYISEAAKLESAVRAYPVASGVTYIRWGKTSCPDKSSLVYKGRVGGSYYEARGEARIISAYPMTRNTLMQLWPLQMLGHTFMEPNTTEIISLISLDYITTTLPVQSARLIDDPR